MLSTLIGFVEYLHNWTRVRMRQIVLYKIRFFVWKYRMPTLGTTPYGTLLASIGLSTQILGWFSCNTPVKDSIPALYILRRKVQSVLLQWNTIWTHSQTTDAHYSYTHTQTFTSQNYLICCTSTQRFKFIIILRSKSLS